jgi:hypothetical protein
MSCLQQRLTGPEGSQNVIDATVDGRKNTKSGGDQSSKDNAKTLTSAYWRCPSALNHESAASCWQLVAGNAETATIFLFKDDIYHRHRRKEQFKHAGDFEFRIYSFPTAQILAQRAVATLSSTRKCQKSIYFLLVLRHTNGNLSTSECLKTATTHSFLFSTSKSSSCTALRCIARTPQGHVLAQSAPGPR